MSIKPTWNPEISLGTLITIFVVGASAAGVYAAKTADLRGIQVEQAGLELELKAMNARQDRADSERARINAEQDQRWFQVIVDIKTDIRELRQEIANRGGGR